MSSAVVSTPAALGRPFVFDDDADPEVRPPSGGPHRDSAEAKESAIARILQSTINNQKSKIPPARVTPASQLEIRPAPEMVSSGVPAIDALTGGLPRGCLTELCGPASSGRTTLLLAALAAATRRGECCAVVDASDALDPQSAAAAGVDLERLLWVRCGEDAPRKNSPPQRHPSTPLRAGSGTEKNGNQKSGGPISRAPSAREVGVREACPELVERVGTFAQATFDFDRTNSRQSRHRLEQVLRATDLLLESGGFGLIALDLGDLPPQAARHIPLTTWFRFRRAIEYTPTILLAIEQRPIAGSCSSLLLQLGPSNGSAADPQNTEPAHAQLLTGLNINADLIRSRLDRKPARSVAFATKTAWAG
jgi:recombination protein RecA